jgi:hypothetical protein
VRQISLQALETLAAAAFQKLLTIAGWNSSFDSTFKSRTFVQRFSAACVRSQT